MDRKSGGFGGWDRMQNGSFANWGSVPPKLKGAGFALKNVAVAKMTEVSAISAVFDKELLVFEPWISVLLDAGEELRFFGVYDLAFPVEDDKPGTPRVCIRSGSWKMDEDYSHFGCAEDKSEYLKSAEQIRIELVFGSMQTFLPIKALGLSLSNLIDQGLCRRPLARSDVSWRKIAVEITSDYFQWKYSYSPFTSAIDDFESWLDKWQTTLRMIATEDLLADECKISYRPSISERIVCR